MKLVRSILLMISAVIAIQCFGEGFRAIFFHGTSSIALSVVGFIVFSIYPVMYLHDLEKRKK